GRAGRNQPVPRLTTVRAARVSRPWRPIRSCSYPACWETKPLRWSNVLRGLLIGICDLIPGVSGGTVAVVLGIYDELLAAIGGFFSREWRRHLAFLLPLGLGVAGALLGFSRAIDYVLAGYYVPTQMFFMGLILGVRPMLLRRSDARRTFARAHLVLMAASALAVAALAFVHPERVVEPMVSLTPAQAAGLF